MLAEQNSETTTNSSAENYSLGLKYFNGEGVETNKTLAFKYFLESAKAGLTKAQAQVGWRFETGIGVSKNYKKAFEWYKKSAEQGFLYAQNAVGRLYNNGSGIQKNYANAFKWFYIAATQNYSFAQYNLGNLYQYGRGVSQNSSNALKWYLKAGSNNYSNSFYQIAEIYHENKDEKAIEWYLKAAENGDCWADFKLGTMYYQGNCTKKDSAKAIHHLENVTQSSEADNDIKGLSYLMMGALQLQQGQTTIGYENFKKAMISSFVKKILLIFAAVGVVVGLIAFFLIIVILYFVLKGNKSFSKLKSWSITETISIFALFIFFQVLATITVAFPLFNSYFNDTFLSLLFWTTVGNIIVVFVGIMFARIRPINVWKQFGFSKNNLIKLLMWISGGYFCIFVISAMYEFIMKLFGIEIEMQMVTNELQKYKDIKSIIIVILIVGIIMPVLEELIFRGILYQALRSKLSIFFSIFISSLIFAVIHINLLYIFPIMIIGIVCAYAFEKTKNILIPIVIHVVNNLFTVIIVIFFM